MLFSTRVAAEWAVSVLDEACSCETTQAGSSSSVQIVCGLQPNRCELRLILLSAKKAVCCQMQGANQVQAAMVLKLFWRQL